MMDVLVDSGVLLRLHYTPDPMHAAINRAVATLGGQGDRLVVAFQNLTEFWSTATRPVTARGGFGLTLSEAARRLARIEQAYPRLQEPPTTYPLWKRLVLRHQVRGKQVHDARLAALLMAHGITHILTLNGPDFARYPGLVVLDPAAVTAPVTPPPPTP